MLTNSKQTILFLLSLLFVYGMLAFTFANQAVFWYMYAFTLLVCIAIAILAGSIEDQLPTWQFYSLVLDTVPSHMVLFALVTGSLHILIIT